MNRVRPCATCSIYIYILQHFSILQAALKIFWTGDRLCHPLQPCRQWQCHHSMSKHPQKFLLFLMCCALAEYRRSQLYSKPCLSALPLFNPKFGLVLKPRHVFECATLGCTGRFRQMALIIPNMYDIHDTATATVARYLYIPNPSCIIDHPPCAFSILQRPSKVMPNCQQVTQPPFLRIGEFLLQNPESGSVDV